MRVAADTFWLPLEVQVIQAGSGSAFAKGRTLPKKPEWIPHYLAPWEGVRAVGKREVQVLRVLWQVCTAAAHLILHLET